VHGAIFGVGLAGALLAGPGPQGTALRLAAGVVAIYGGTSGLADAYVLAHRLAGIEVPAFMRHPILSKTIAEFWSVRWNRAVHGMLRGALYRPLARRGLARTGVLASFAGSAALHFWIVIFSTNAWLALQMASFFLVQGVLALVENGLRVRRWRPAAARAWTVGTFALSSPLFVEPFLRGLGI
jgi:D-alanyl-lipoteichoic acid acyltransferase DltB (MBOAT superfamily)